MAKIEQRQLPRAELRLRVPPDPRLGGYVRQAVMGFAETQGIADAQVSDFIAAVGEALANAIEHAHTREPIDVWVWLHGDRLLASVHDRGIGFAPNKRTLAPHLPDPYTERGRGLPIMRSYADVFRVRSAPGKGTRVTLGCHVHRAA